MKRAKLINSLSRVLSTYEGKTLLAWLLESADQCGPIGGYSNDPLQMAFMEGRRSLGRELWNLVAAIDPKYLQNITSQIIEERINDERANERANEPDSQ